MTATSDTNGAGQPAGDLSRESQLEAAKDNPPRALKTQRPTRFSLISRAHAQQCRKPACIGIVALAAPLARWCGTRRSSARIWAKAQSTSRRAVRRSLGSNDEGKPLSPVTLLPSWEISDLAVGDEQVRALVDPMLL